MNDFREIVDIAQFARAIAAVAVIVPVLALLVGGIMGSRRGDLKRGLVKGAAIGALGPLVYVLWLLYSYLVRYDPQTGYVGLHRVSIMLLNVAIFLVVGVVLGLVFSRIFRPVTTE